MVDNAQLKKLDMSVSPASFPFTVNEGIDGDWIDGIEFVLTSNKPEVQQMQKEVPAGQTESVVKETPIQKDTLVKIETPVTKEATAPKKTPVVKEKPVVKEPIVVKEKPTNEKPVLKQKEIARYQIQLMALSAPKTNYKNNFARLKRELGLTVNEKPGEAGIYR